MENAVKIINKSQIISVMNKTLQFIDERLVDHGERVAYIVMEMLRNADASLQANRDSIVILSILHDTGAYKTEEIDEMISFDSREIWSHSIYGYLFLKNMSPIGDMAEAILYHHLDYKDYGYANSAYLDYAALIYLADRVDVLAAASKGDCNFDLIRQGSGTRFDPRYVELLYASNPNEIVESLRDGSYHKEFEQIAETIDLTVEQAFEYLKMMTFSVDFRSENTVSHTINTTSISTELGKRLHLSKDELSKLYIGALLHDIGKVAISTEILEFQGRLTPDQMENMKQHVEYTHQIVYGLVDPEICNIASRHHEKLDGSGYPNGLGEADLTISEQIIAVADIVSALTSKRSYKEAFPKEKTLDIIREMQEKKQLSYQVCEIILSDFDDIMEITDSSRNPIVRIYNNMQKDYVELNQRISRLVQQSKLQK